MIFSTLFPTCKVPTFPKKNAQVRSYKFKNSSKIECTFDAVGFTKGLGATCSWIYNFFLPIFGGGAVFLSSFFYMIMVVCICQSPINHLFLARGFVIEKFSKVFINLEKSVIIKGVTHAVTLMDTEPFFNGGLSPHSMPPMCMVVATARLRSGSRLRLGATVPGLALPMRTANLPLLHQRHRLRLPIVSPRRATAAPRLACPSTGAQTFGVVAVMSCASALSVAHMSRTSAGFPLTLSWASIPWSSVPLFKAALIAPLKLGHTLTLALMAHPLRRRSHIRRLSGLQPYMWRWMGSPFVGRSWKRLTLGRRVVVREVARIGWIVAVDPWCGVVRGSRRPSPVRHRFPRSLTTWTLVTSQLGVGWSRSQVGWVAVVVGIAGWLETTRDPRMCKVTISGGGKLYNATLVRCRVISGPQVTFAHFRKSALGF